MTKKNKISSFFKNLKNQYFHSKKKNTFHPVKNWVPPTTTEKLSIIYDFIYFKIYDLVHFKVYETILFIYFFNVLFLIFRVFFKIIITYFEYRTIGSINLIFPGVSYATLIITSITSKNQEIQEIATTFPEFVTPGSLQNLKLKAITQNNPILQSTVLTHMHSDVTTKGHYVDFEEMSRGALGKKVYFAMPIELRQMEKIMIDIEIENTVTTHNLPLGQAAEFKKMNSLVSDNPQTVHPVLVTDIITKNGETVRKLNILTTHPVKGNLPSVLVGDIEKNPIYYENVGKLHFKELSKFERDTYVQKVGIFQYLTEEQNNRNINYFKKYIEIALREWKVLISLSGNPKKQHLVPLEILNFKTKYTKLLSVLNINIDMQKLNQVTIELANSISKSEDLYKKKFLTLNPISLVSEDTLEFCEKLNSKVANFKAPTPFSNFSEKPHIVTHPTINALNFRTCTNSNIPLILKGINHFKSKLF